MKPLAVYTTVYPGVERFLADWYVSLQEQTDQDFQLWIGVDGLPIDAVEEALGASPSANWVPADVGDTHAQVRQRGLELIAQSCDAVVLVDSDDVLHPSRVAAARSSLASSDVAACSLRLVSEGGADLGLVLGLPGVTPDDVLPRHNVFGLSNTAYTARMLARCLPIPRQAVLVDWYLVTRAWLCGAALSFDPEARMDYRQHGANTARVLAPFTADQVVSDTNLVRRHFAILRGAIPPRALPERIDLVAKTAADVDAFWRHVVLQPDRLQGYVEALNAAPPPPLWWTCVAYPPLRDLWTTREEPA